jgi:hypothetical protein
MRSYIKKHNYWGEGQDSKIAWIERCRNAKQSKKLKKLGWLDKDSKDKPFINIEYSYNKYFFRSIEFEEPHDAIAVFGCSFTEGEGLPAKDRWGDVLAKKLNLKCYNFGEGGKGMNAVYNNISEWIPKLKPKAVFVFASFPFRHDIFINSTERTLNYNITNESLDCSKGVANTLNEFYRVCWSKDERNYQQEYKKNKEAIKYICLNLDIPCVIISCEDYFLNDPIQPYARDLQHPGVEQNIRIAQAMLEEYKNA